MATRTPLHVILTEEAKDRSYRRSGTSWLKDFGDLVAEIRLYGRIHIYHCATSLFIKLDAVPDEYAELLKELKPGQISLYIPPKKSPDGHSHLLEIVYRKSLNPVSDPDWKLSRQFENQLVIEGRLDEADRTPLDKKPNVPKYQRRLLHLDQDGGLSEDRAEIDRRALRELAFAPLEICTTRRELVDRFHRNDPPFGKFLSYAEKYLS